MRKLVLFAIPFGLATLIYVYLLSAPLGLLFGGTAAVCCMVFCLLKFERKKIAAILAAGLAVGFLWSTGYELLLLRPVWAADGQKVEAAFTVCDYPVKTDYGCKIKTELKLNGRTAKTVLFLYGTVPDASPGDTLCAVTRLHKTERADGEDYNFISTGYLLRALGSENRIIKCEATPLRFYPAVLSQRLRTALAQSVPPDAAGFLQALVLGDKTGVSQELRSEISDAGFSHVIAVSGMHVSILLGLLCLLTRKIPILSAILGIPTILFFVLMTGGSPSVVRAGIMQTMLLLAPLLRREADGPTTVCVAMLVILLGNPYTVANVSFQLSFGAITGIFLCSAKVYAHLSKPEWMQRLLKNRWTRPAVFFLCSCIATTVGALLLTVPLMALHFGKISLYTVLSNLLVLCVISFCFAGGLLTGVVGLFWLPGAKLIGGVIAWPVRYIRWVADWVSKLPSASLSATAPYISIWLLFVYLFLILAFLRKEENQVVLTGACILVSLLVSLLFARLDRSFSDFSITVLNVGQGECIGMQAGGFSAMVDCGGDSAYAAEKTAKEYLACSASGHLDCLLLTHYDADHTNGVPKLLSEAAVTTLYLPDVADDSGTRDEIEAAARACGTRIVYVTQDMTLSFKGGMMQLYAPVSDYDGNSACLSVLFSASGYDMLITGDMDFFSEYDLLVTHELPDVDLFIAGHHGSMTSSSKDLLAQIKPETVIISVGKNNNYGHPTQEALERFLAVGAEIYRTDECGTITVRR